MEKYKAKVGDIVATEFGYGTIQAITKQQVIVKEFKNQTEFAIDRYDSLLSIPVEPAGTVNNNLPKFHVGDFVYVDDDMFCKVVLITKEWVIVENEKGESPISIIDSNFFLSHDIEFID